MTEPITTLDLIEIELSDFYLPHLIDLNALFGAWDLDYEVEVERAGVVAVDSITSDGMLFLIADTNASSGTRTRIAVRAVDIAGVAMATSFDVLVVDLSTLAA